MLSIQPQASGATKEAAELNLLPCRVRHTGPVDASEKHWRITDGNTTYFRGRKLVGKKVALPESYSGHVLAATGEIVAPGELERSKADRPQEGNGEGKEIGRSEKEIGVLKEVSTFGGITVWGHDTVPEEGTEHVMRAMEEWVGLANKIHDFSAEEERADGCLTERQSVAEG